MNNTLDTASVLTVGAIGTVLPSLVANWVTIVVGILSGIWVLYQIIARIVSDIKKLKNK